MNLHHLSRVLLILCGLTASGISSLLAQGTSAVIPKPPSPPPNQFREYSVADLRAGNASTNSLVATYGTVQSITPVDTAGMLREYVLRGDELGIEITVRTPAELPEVNSRVSVWGTIQVGGGEPYIHEVGRSSYGSPGEVQPPEPPVVPAESWLKKNWPYVAAGVAALAFIIGGLVLLRPAKAPDAIDAGPAFGGVNPTMPGVPVPTGSASATGGLEDAEITVRSSEVTVRVPEHTIKWLPGHLEITAGSRIGAKLPLCGGDRITLGRQHSGAKGAAFIGLEDTSKALSRAQAIIVFDSRSRAFMLESQRVANATVVDGKPLDEGAVVPLSDGSEIAFPGGIRFVFRNGAYYPSGRS